MSGESKDDLLKTLTASCGKDDTVTFKASTSSLVQNLSITAEKLGKEVPDVEINDSGIVFMSESVLINNVMMHFFRNSMDHGIETTEERNAKGKKSIGKNFYIPR